MGSMNEEIAQRVASLTYEGLSEPARERLLLCLLANLSVGVAGVRYCVLPEPAMAGGRFMLLSGRAAANAHAAAFWNAAVMHARTQDDFHPVGNLHIGTVVIPALLATVDDAQISGRRFLDALAAGYMVATGMSRSASPKTTPRGVRSTGYYSPFGAAAAVARARGLDAGHIANALALTTVFAAGTTQAWIDGSDEWQLHPAHAAETGLRVVELDSQGIRGGAHALDGKAGFYHALLNEDVSFDAIRGDFEPSAAIEESAIKRYPVSGICQSVVLAAERAAARIGDAGTIKSVLVEMNPFEITYPGTLNRGPEFRSFGDRLMSATFCAAAVLSRGTLQFEDFHGARSGLRDRVVGATEVRKDDGLGLLSSRVTVELADGEKVVEKVENSREEVRIDWELVRDWGADLWQEAGRERSAFDTCLDAVRGLSKAREVHLPL